MAGGAADSLLSPTDGADPVGAVLSAVAGVAPEVRAALPDRRGYVDETNVSGDDVTAADVYADDLLRDALGDLEGVGQYVSEEREDLVDVGGDPGEDAVSVAVDPLDGSSNLRSNNPMGTIVGVFDAPLPAAGRDLLASVYVLYGPTTTMVVARDGTVREYLLDDDGPQVVTESVTLPEEPTVFGFGGGRDAWTDSFRTYADEVAEELKLRYGGALVADVNQVLTYGGIFAYPALRDRPEGKLRTLFEAAPIAHIVESAGGRSSDGATSLLERPPREIHERTPVYVGDEDYVDRLERALA